MNPRVFSITALKVLAIYILLEGVTSLPSLITMLQFYSIPTDGEVDSLPLVLTTLITPIIIGVVLWLSSEKLTDIVLRNCQEIERESVLDTQSLQSIAIATVGLILTVYSIPELLSSVIQLLGSTNTINEEKVFDIRFLAYFVATVTKLFIGISLILGVDGWIRLIRKLKSLGYK